MDREAQIRNLVEMNVLIGTKEDAADWRFFSELLADAFAMRRADGTTVTRETFLGDIKPAGADSHRSTDVTSVELLGQNRAAVKCLVERGGKLYDNHRIFIRSSPDSSWKLLAWANEVLGDGEAARPSA